MMRKLISYAFRELQSKISSLPNRLRRDPLILLKENPKKITIASLGCTIYVLNLETVPYTNRRHLVWVPTRLERRVGDWLFEREKSGSLEGKILPPSHPDDIRVQKIAKDVIEATRRDMRKTRHSRAQTAHVEEFNWEVVVVDDPIFYACCSPGGKIVVHTGLLRAVKSDDEIAATIGHEVGHAVARHLVEKVFGKLLLFVFFPLFMLSNRARLRRCEREADYIGLFLSASAGYDPLVAVQRLQKRQAAAATTNGWNFLVYIISSHPPYEERAHLLSHPKVMEEALSMYRALSHQIYKNN